MLAKYSSLSIDTVAFVWETLFGFLLQFNDFKSSLISIFSISPCGNGAVILENVSKDICEVRKPS